MDATVERTICTVQIAQLHHVAHPLDRGRTVL
jgi:hypothetical protein